MTETYTKKTFIIVKPINFSLHLKSEILIYNNNMVHIRITFFPMNFCANEYFINGRHDIFFF
jgi:hypothetical protein